MIDGDKLTKAIEEQANDPKSTLWSVLTEIVISFEEAATFFKAAGEHNAENAKKGWAAQLVADAIADARSFIEEPIPVRDIGHSELFIDPTE